MQRVKQKYCVSNFHQFSQLRTYLTFPLCHLQFFHVLMISRLTVVSNEAKKGQRDRHKTKRATNYCVSLHERTFSSFDVIITVNISRTASTFKPALKTQNLLANITHYPKDQSK